MKNAHLRLIQVVTDWEEQLIQGLINVLLALHRFSMMQDGTASITAWGQTALSSSEGTRWKDG